MQIVVTLVVIWLLFVVLSWLLHAAKWLLIVAIIASLAVVAAKYLPSASGKIAPHLFDLKSRPVPAPNIFAKISRRNRKAVQ